MGREGHAALTAVMIGLLGAALPSPAAAGLCRAEAGQVAPETSPATGSSEPPLAFTAGEIAFKADNRLVPKFDEDCATRVDGAFLGERLRLNVAAPHLDAPQTPGRPSEAARPWFASMAVELVSTGAAAWTVESSFAARDADESGTLEQYFGAHNAFALFDERRRAAIDLGATLDNESGRAGLAASYKLEAELLRGEAFSATGAARYGLTGPGFMDDDVKATADREVREIGLSVAAGRFDLDLERALETDNTDRDPDKATRRWSVWSAELGIDLSGLHLLLPEALEIAVEQEHLGHTEREAGALDELSRSLDLELTWPHHGGKTSLALSTSRLEDRAAEGDESSYGIGVRRKFESDLWELDLETGYARESELVAGRKAWSHVYELELDLSYRPGRWGELELELGLGLAQEAERGGLTLDDAAVQLNYGLRF